MRPKLLYEWCAVAAATLGIIAALDWGDATDRLDNVYYDVLVGFAAPPVSDRILLVEIDDRSIARIGRWPWPRSTHARMLEELAGARPSAVGYDVLFTESAGPDEDRALGDALAALDKVAMPVLFETPGTDGRPVDTIRPIEPLATAARALGQVALLPDRDGVARTVPLSFVAEGRVWRHLMEETYRIALGESSPAFLRTAGREARVAVPFQSKTGGFRTVSFASVMAGEVPPEFIEGRIVLVGVSATGLGDRFRVPTRSGALLSGVELQANLLNSLLADRFVAPVSATTGMAVSLLPAFALLVSFWFLRPSRAFVVFVTLVGLVLLVPAILLVLRGTWLPPFPALAGLLVAYPLWGWRRLQFVDDTMGEELMAISAELALAPGDAPVQAYLDPIGGQAARLRSAIGRMRDLRRLVSDTVDGVDDPIIVTDLDDNIILCNSAASLLLGSASAGAQLYGLLEDLAGLQIDFEDDVAEIGLEGRIFAPRRFPLCNHAEEHRGWIVHLVDISAIRRAQHDRQAALEFLSHDMRSPQSSIITLIERHRKTVTDEAVADRIVSLARKTLRLADDFVHMARFSVASFEPQEVNLADILLEAADELWPLASRRNIRIATPRERGAFFMLGEHDALSRTLINLLDNAVKFSPDGGVIECSLRQAEGGMIECIIEDEGPGIPDERRENLFERFGARRSGDGLRTSSGLGLAFVAAAVHRHGGEILHEVRSPHGTRIIVRFPLVK